MHPGTCVHDDDQATPRCRAVGWSQDVVPSHVMRYSLLSLVVCENYLTPESWHPPAVTQHGQTRAVLDVSVASRQPRRPASPAANRQKKPPRYRVLASCCWLPLYGRFFLDWINSEWCDQGPRLVPLVGCSSLARGSSKV